MDTIFKQLALLGDIWVLWILVASSIASFGVIVERWLAFRKNKIDFPPFLEDLRKNLEAEDLHGAQSLALQEDSVENVVARAGLVSIYRDPKIMEQAMLSRLVSEKSRLEHHLIILGTLGNNAPFIGLFGTVLGIIKAFNDLAVSGTSGIGVVMTGISSALVATAFGILVAIPAVIANNYFQTRIRRIVSNSQTVIHLLQSYHRNEAAEKLRAAGGAIQS